MKNKTGSQDRSGPSHQARREVAAHGVIVGPDGAPWMTDGGLNAIVRVDPATEKVSSIRYPPCGTAPT